MQVLWGHLYGVLLLGEPETVFTVTGSALIASGVVSLSLRPSPQRGAACEAAAECGDPAATPCRTHAGAALADTSSAAATTMTPAPGVAAPEGAPEGSTESPASRGQRAGLAQRLRAWFARQGGAQARMPVADAAEAEGLVARSEKRLWQQGAPHRGSVLQGQWSGTGESPEHVSLLVPP